MNPRTLLRTLGAVLTGAVLALCLGCGTDDDGGAVSNKATARTGAKNAVESALSLKDLEGKPENDVALGNVAGMYGHLQVIPLGKSSQPEGQSGALTADPDTGLGSLAGALSAGCYSKDGNTITYTDCSLTGVTLSGATTLDGNHITFDLTITVDPGAYTIPEGTGASTTAEMIKGVTVVEKGDLTITATNIDGTVDVDITTKVDLAAATGGATSGIPGLGGGGTTDVKTTMKATFAVVLSGTPPCATSGTIAVVSSGGLGGLSGATGTGSGDGTTTATFGPECGDVELQ